MAQNPFNHPWSVAARRRKKIKATEDRVDEFCQDRHTEYQEFLLSKGYFDTASRRRQFVFGHWDSHGLPDDVVDGD